MKNTKTIIGSNLNITSSLKFSAVVVALGLSSAGAFAAALASDTAANYIVPGWSTTPANLGTGFGAWNITANNNLQPPYSGTYLDLTAYGNSGSVLDPAPPDPNGASWGTYGNGTGPNGELGSLSMIRPFTPSGGSSSLAPGQMFSFALGSGGVGGTGSSLSASIGTAFNLTYAGGGADNFTFSVGGGAANPIPVNFANLGAGLEIALKVTGPANNPAEGYSLSISPFFGGPTIYSTSGTFNSIIYNTSSFNFLDSNTSGNGYVNDLMISVPEPSTLAVLGLSGIALLIRRRK